METVDGREQLGEVTNGNALCEVIVGNYSTNELSVGNPAQKIGMIKCTIVYAYTYTV